MKTLSDRLQNPHDRHVEMPINLNINKCISEGLTNIATWYRGILGLKFTKFVE